MIITYVNLERDFNSFLIDMICISSWHTSIINLESLSLANHLIDLQTLFAKKYFMQMWILTVLPFGSQNTLWQFIWCFGSQNYRLDFSFMFFFQIGFLAQLRCRNLQEILLYFGQISITILQMLTGFKFLK